MIEKISICIPVYNGSRYLRQCLDSVLVQTYPPLEILIVDDCSTDDSAEIINKYAETNASIRYVVNENNLGLVGNWNRCIHLAKGEWIKFVFQDDMIEENCLEVFADYAKKSESPLLVCYRHFITGEDMSARLKRYYEEGLPTLSRIHIEVEDDFISSGAISNAAVEHMSMNIIGEPTVTMFKKSVVDHCGYYNELLEQICDLEYVLRIASRYGITHVPAELAHFRIHDSSVTSTNLATKHYMLSCLEPVKLAHLLLYDDVYVQFRENLTPYHLERLELYFRVRGHEAFVKAKLSESNMNEFEEAEGFFHHLRDLRNPSSRDLLYYFILRLKRIMNKLAGR